MTNLDKIKTFDDVRQREIFTDPDAGMNYVAHVSNLLSADDAPDVDIFIYGYEADEDGTLLPIEGKEWPTDSNGTPFSAMAAVLSKTEEVDIEEDGKLRTVNKQVPKALFLQPIPSVDQLLADSTGRAMVEAVIAKELNHRAFRPVRATENMEAALGEMPASIAAYCTSGRESSASSALAVYNDLFGDITKQLKEKVNAFKVARITKAELRKAMENAAYAAHYYPTLEEAGFFKLVCGLFSQFGAKADYDVSLIDTWAATRDEQQFKADESTGGLDDLEGLLDGFTVGGDDANEDEGENESEE